MRKGYTEIITTKTVTVEGEMILPGKEIEVKTNIANQLIDNDAAEKVKKTDNKENLK